MELTRGAKRLLIFLQARCGRKGHCWWGQNKLAQALGYCVRTIGRWVSELVRLGRLESIRRGSTSNLYRPKDTGENVRSVRTKYPNVSIELKLKSEKQASLADLLAVANALPAAQHRELRGIWENAEERIRRARNPETYARAVLMTELGRLRKPSQRSGPENGAGYYPPSVCGTQRQRRSGND